MTSQERGDTIIEVILAFVLFSSIAVGSIALMNRGTATAQRALETTLVRQQIDAQAEVIRYVRDAASTTGAVSEKADWERMISRSEGGMAVAIASGFGANGESCPKIPDNAFFMNTVSGKLVDDSAHITSADSAESAPYAQVIDDGSGKVSSSGLWVEAVRKNPVQNFVDFHIRACWYAPASTTPAVIGTIIRIALV